MTIKDQMLVLKRCFRLKEDGTGITVFPLIIFMEIFIPSASL
jgi:hypothetical protein